MTYVLKMILASAASLATAGLAVALTPWYSFDHLPDVVLLAWLGFVSVVLPCLVWFWTMRLMRLL